MLIRQMQKALFTSLVISGYGTLAMADPAPSAAADSSYRLQAEAGGKIDTQAYRLQRKYKTPSPASKRARATADDKTAVLASDSAAPGSSVAIFLHSDKLASQPYSREIALAAAAAALDPALVHAVIYVESRYRQNAVSPMGAIGLMQLMPDTAARYGVKDPGSSAKVNIKAGTMYLRDLLHMFDNRVDLALAAYNAGEGAVLKYSRKIPPYRETQAYVRAVLAKYNEWQGPQQPGHRLRSDAVTALDEATSATPRVEYMAGTRLSLSDSRARTNY